MATFEFAVDELELRSVGVELDPLVARPFAIEPSIEGRPGVAGALRGSFWAALSF